MSVAATPRLNDDHLAKIPRSSRASMHDDQISDISRFRRRSSIASNEPNLGSIKITGHLKLKSIIETPTEILSIECRRTPNTIFAALTSGAIQVNRDGVPPKSLIYPGEALAATCVRSIPRQPDLIAATYASGGVVLWNVASGKAIHKFEEPTRQSLCLSASNDGAQFAVSGSTGDINLYNVATQQPVRTLKASYKSHSESLQTMDGHRLRVFAVLYHPEQPHVLISAGWDNTCHFWDDRAERSTRRIFGPHVCGEGLDIDPVHEHILTASWRRENNLQIWDFGTGKLIKNVPLDQQHDSLLYCCKWLGEDDIVCGGSDDNMGFQLERSSLMAMGVIAGLPNAATSVDCDAAPSSNYAAMHLPSGRVVFGAGTRLVVCNKVKPF